LLVDGLVQPDAVRLRAHDGATQKLVLDVEVPFRVDGRSALGAPRSTNDKPYYGNDVNPFGVGVVPPVTVDGTEGWASVLERSVGRFLPAAGDRWRLWRVGPSADLVGQEADSVPAGRLRPVDATLLTPEAFDDVAPAGLRPALVRGHVDGLDLGTPLAISVNGVVAATAPVYEEEGRPAFAVMVDEALLREGANEVLVYEVR
ncbi:MAG: hypothetical protein ABL966_16720, partial [Acidimicrobiales bacterium]